MKTIIMSVKPRFTKDILSGIKSVELRKTAPVPPFNLLIAETGTGGKIVCKCKCLNVTSSVPALFGHDLEKWLRGAVRISVKEFNEYVSDGPYKLLFLSDVEPAEENVIDYGITRAPQSWQYLKEEEE